MAMTAAQKTDAYRFFAIAFNAAPGATYMSQLFDAYTAGMTTQQIVNVYTTKPEFTATYPVFLSDTDFATKLVNNIVKASASTTNKAAAVADIVASLALGQTRGDVIYTIFNNLANKALTDADWGATAKQMANQVVVSQYYTETLIGNTTTLSTLQAVIANVTDTTDVSTNAAIEAAIGSAGGVGTTYALTTGVDVLTGGTTNDTFNANPGAASANTFTALDNIDGGGGTDIFNITEIGATGAAAITLNASATVKNIETLNYTVSTDNVGDALTADVSAWTGLTTANFVLSGTDAPITAITTKGNVTAASINGSVAAGITDSATTDTLATLTATDATGLVTVTSDALTALTLNNSDAGATVAAAAATRSLALTLNGIDGGTITDAEATTLNVASSGTKTTAATLWAVKATTVGIASAVSTVITDVKFTAATAVTVTGAGATTISALTDVTALTKFDASGSTGGLTVGAAIGTGVLFTGGAGKDSVIVGATTKAITTGDADDTVTVAGVSALGTGGSIDAGAGTGDTIKFSTYANGVTATATSTFAGTVSNFEKLNLSGVNSAAAAAINLANLDNINYVTLSATNTETTTISGFSSGGTIAFTADQTATKDATASIVNANTGTTDVLNVVLSKATALAAVELIAADVETVNITSTETATTLLGNVTHALELNATGAKALTVTGNAGVTFGTLTGATALTSIDASGVTAGLVSLTTAALASAATIKGGAGANTVVATAATKAVTYTGGAKVDTVTIDNAQANVIDTGAGNDVIVVGSGANTITAGDGDDSITVGASAGLTTINVGAGTDTVILGAKQTAAGFYTSITGMTAGDMIDFQGTPTANDALVFGALGTKITLGGASSFANYLDAAAAAATGATNHVTKWFQYGGNTYLVVDNSNTTTFADGVDSVVELVGLVDLSTSTTTAVGVLTLV